MLAYGFPLPKSEAAVRSHKDILDFGITHGYLSSFKEQGLCCRKLTQRVEFNHLSRDGEVSDGSVDPDGPRQKPQALTLLRSLSPGLLARVVSGD